MENNQKINKLKVPEILAFDEMKVPETPEDDVLYVSNFGFEMNITSPFKIMYRPEEDIHELTWFEVETGNCLTHEHHTSDINDLKKALGDDYSKHVSPELEKYLEEDGYLIPSRQISISPQEDRLTFDHSGSDLHIGNFIKREYTKTPIHELPKNGWDRDPNLIGYIWVYDGYHDNVDSFLLEILDFNEDKSKMRIRMEIESRSILFVGWVPVEYINPLSWFKNFFEKVKSSPDGIVIKDRSENIFYKNGMNHSPEWKELVNTEEDDSEEARHSMIFKIAEKFNVSVSCKKITTHILRQDGSVYVDQDSYEWQFRNL